MTHCLFIENSHYHCRGEPYRSSALCCLPTAPQRYINYGVNRLNCQVLVRKDRSKEPQRKLCVKTDFLYRSTRQSSCSFDHGAPCISVCIFSAVRIASGRMGTPTFLPFLCYFLQLVPLCVTVRPARSQHSPRSWRCRPAARRL